MKDWRRDRYRFDDDGNFESADEAREACENGDLEELDDGCFWDRDTGDKYWWDGEKK